MKRRHKNYILDDIKDPSESSKTKELNELKIFSNKLIEKNIDLNNQVNIKKILEKIIDILIIYY